MKSSTVLIGLTLCGVLTPLHGEIIGGVDFPQGAISFADAVVSYSPGIVGPNPAIPFRGSANALGPPNFSGIGCASQAACEYVSLGDGGNIVLQFIDNQLTGNGASTPDLWVFEIGPDVEDTFVDISTDGVTWIPVGKVFGSTAGVDLDAFGFGPSSKFSYVRLTDDTNEGDQNGSTVGADIDAVGAISTVPNNPIPEPATGVLSAAGILLAGLWTNWRARRSGSTRS